MAVSAAVFLLFLAPVMRGGNRHIALIALETVGLLFLLALWARTLTPSQGVVTAPRTFSSNGLLIGFLLLSPAWLGLVYLAPIPAEFWSALPGRNIYPQLARDAGIPVGATLSLSLVPEATKASLLAGLLMAAGFLAGYASRLRQLRVLLSVVVGMALLQTLLGLLQISGGWHSSLFFGMGGDRPMGTFANPNHFANYLAMALAGYAWLAGSNLVRSQHTDHSAARFGPRQLQALWIAGGLLLVVGVLMTRSRGAAIFGMPAAVLALGAVALAGDRSLSWRGTVFLLSAVLVAAIGLIGLGTLLSRFDLGGISGAAEFRTLLSSSTWDGAKVFWPLGSGWGTYSAVYPRFQPAAVAGYADYAHQDYSQMLFEGGIFSIILALAFAWLAGTRAVRLFASFRRHRKLSSEELAATVCGLGLLGFLLHSLVEFNMHIPANAILAALLAGAYLRPIPVSSSRQ